jgi:hypothetical protein
MFDMQNINKMYRIAWQRGMNIERRILIAFFLYFQEVGNHQYKSNEFHTLFETFKYEIQWGNASVILN